MKTKTILIKMKCTGCGKEAAQLVPLEIIKEVSKKTHELTEINN